MDVHDVFGMLQAAILDNQNTFFSIMKFGIAPLSGDV